MSFIRAKENFTAASQSSSEEERVLAILADGLLELTKSLQRQLADMDTRLKSIESKVRSLSR